MPRDTDTAAELDAEQTRKMKILRDEGVKDALNSIGFGVSLNEFGVVLGEDVTQQSSMLTSRLYEKEMNLLNDLRNMGTAQAARAIVAIMSSHILVKRGDVRDNDVYEGMLPYVVLNMYDTDQLKSDASQTIVPSQFPFDRRKMQFAIAALSEMPDSYDTLVDLCWAEYVAHRVNGVEGRPTHEDQIIEEILKYKSPDYILDALAGLPPAYAEKAFKAIESLGDERAPDRIADKTSLINPADAMDLNAEKILSLVRMNNSIATGEVPDIDPNDVKRCIRNVVKEALNPETLIPALTGTKPKSHGKYYPAVGDETISKLRGAFEQLDAAELFEVNFADTFNQMFATAQVIESVQQQAQHVHELTFDRT